MSFVLYKHQTSGDTIHYERFQPIKVGGTSGPLARHVRWLPGDAVDKGWEIDPARLVRLAGIADEGLAVLFEVNSGQAGAVCLYRLHRVCGVARDRKTHLSLDFEVLVDQVVSVPPDEFKRSFSLPAVQIGKRLCEVLQLGGGPDGGDWRWEAPAMKLGATLVGPAISQKS
jgi:hypothetical protein